MALKYLAFVLSVLLTGCATQPANNQTWSKRAIVGLDLELIDPDHPNAFELYSFHAKFVDVTSGEKSSDGPLEKISMVAPEYRWTLVGGQLQIGDGENATRWTLVSRDASKLVVKSTTGEFLTFTISQAAD